MEYATLDQLRAAAERDVEVQGMTYRVRRVTPLELLEAWGAVALAPEDVPASPEDAKKLTPAKARKIGDRTARLLVAGLLEPRVTIETVYLVPQAAWGPLVEAISELSELNRPFGAAASTPASS